MAQNWITSERTQRLFVLTLLREGDKTGFEIVHALETRRDFSFAMSEGMLYPLLYRLCDEGLLSSYEKTTIVGPRRYYRLTRAGSSALCTKSKLCAQKRLSDAMGGGVCAKHNQNTD